jgi:geranylgeranyl diphosphate synthase, type II
MMIREYLHEKRAVVEKALDTFMLAAQEPFTEHIEAMRYSLFAGGKRVRPILCLAAGTAINDSTEITERLLPIAVALECIHTYSLIHDDLPAMDDDALRRGKPTNHMLYGEAGAILAGDGLLTYAFDLLSKPDITTINPSDRLKIISIIARSAGSIGMVGGQDLDMKHENKQYPIETLKTIHRHKTGSLITCSVLAGAVGAEANRQQFEALKQYGDNIGLAFQIVDDLLDATSTTEQLGKSAGSDTERGKATYPDFYGIEKTRKLAQEAIERSITALTSFDEKAEPMRALATYIYTRSN